MSDQTPIDTRAALLLRLRYERALGLESVAPRVLEARPALKNEQAAAPPPDSTPAKPAAAPVPAGEKAARWADLEKRAMACTACGLHRERNSVVLEDGNRTADLMFIGEGPGADEDRQGKPFVGRAGQLLNKIIGAMGFTREDVYICNIVKCRPPGNRTPESSEVATCWPFLDEQIQLVEPKVIVALGSPAAKTLLNVNQGIMSLRGNWKLYNGIRVMPTFHPAYVLRQYTEQTRRAVWADMQEVVRHLKENA